MTEVTNTEVPANTMALVRLSPELPEYLRSEGMCLAGWDAEDSRSFYAIRNPSVPTYVVLVMHESDPRSRSAWAITDDRSVMQSLAAIVPQLDASQHRGWNVEAQYVEYVWSPSSSLTDRDVMDISDSEESDPDETTFGELRIGECFVTRTQSLESFSALYVKVSESQYALLTGPGSPGTLDADYQLRRIPSETLGVILRRHAGREHELANLRERVAGHDAYVQRIYDRLEEEANARDWCSEFDDIMEELGFPRRDTEYRVMVEMSISVPRGESPREWLDDNFSSPGDLVYYHGRIEER